MVFATTCLLIGLFLPTPGRASVIDAGYDLFSTDPSGTTFGGVNFQGDPLGAYNFGGGSVNVGNTDTIIQRLSTVTVPASGSVNVNIQVDAMQLESVSPMFGAQNGFLNLDGSQLSSDTGSLAINANGTFTSFFDVFFDIQAGSLTGTTEATGSLSVTGSGDWVSTPSGWYVTSSSYDVTPQLSTGSANWPTASESGVMTLTTAVPEPGTMIAGALMLLPLGSGAVRRLGKKLQAA